MTYYIIQYFDYELSGEVITSYLFPRIYDKPEDAKAAILKAGYVSTNGDYWGFVKENDAYETYLVDDDNGDYVMLDDGYVVATAHIVPVKFEND